MTNLASYNFYNFVANETLKEKAITTLRTYGVGPCGPPNFYGTQDVHKQTEADVAAHLGVPACIIYAQAFSTISSVIPAFSKRGDIIVADRAVNYSIRKGIQLSRSTVYWYEHNDMEDLERVLQKIVKSSAKKPLTRRFIVGEGLYENVGDYADLAKMVYITLRCFDAVLTCFQVQLKQRYKFRIILDETWSYGVLGATGRGITELQHVDPGQVDMIIGSLAGPLCAGGGFCAGSKEVIDHQRISSNSYTFSAALPAILATTASETVRMLHDQPELGILLRENIRALRAQLDPRSEWVRCQSSAENPIQLLVLKDEVISSRDLSDHAQELLMQEIIDEVCNYSRYKIISNGIYGAQANHLQTLANGVLITRASKMPETLGASGSDLQWQPQPALKVCVTVGLSKKEMEKAGIVIRHAITKIMMRKK